VPSAAFAEHFTDRLYDDPGDEFAPFGSDEGWELLMDWADRRAELESTPTLARVLECEPSAVREYVGPMAGVDGLESAMFITSAAFVVLRLAGRLTDDDRRLALEALDFMIRTLPAVNASLSETPVPLLTQRSDLLSWSNPA